LYKLKFFPDNGDEEKLIIGVVADTHLPRRGKKLPKALIAGLDE